MIGQTERQARPLRSRAPHARRAAIGGIAIALVCVVSILLQTTAQAAWPGRNGKIVFYKFNLPALSAQIYSMNSRGQGQTNLSAAGGGANQADIQPSVSPDGRRIAFARLDQATFSGQIWVMNIDGSHQTDVSNDPTIASESGPAWTEDGSHLLFVKLPPGSFPGDQGGGPASAGGAIWVRRADGKGSPRSVTSGPKDANPAMSPDGDRIAFSRPIGGVRHLVVMKADGDGRLVDLGPGSKPDWSPDGTKLLYGQGGSGPIMVVRLSDPSSAHALTGPGFEAPAWSPSGTKIVYMHCAFGGPQCQIGIMSATGQNQHDITSDQSLSDQKPNWQAASGGDNDREDGAGD